MRPLPDLNISLCGHGMLKTTEPDQPREAFVVPDLSRDWRYKNNVSSRREYEVGEAPAYPSSRSTASISRIRRQSRFLRIK